MRRDDDALEVRLKNGQLVGWLLGRTSDCTHLVVRHDIILTAPGECPVWGDDIIEERILQIKKYVYGLLRSKMAGMSKREQELDIQNNTAFYAERQMESHHDYMFWQWKAAVLETMDDYEFVFDCDCFEPFDDGEPDLDQKREPDRIWFDEYHEITDDKIAIAAKAHIGEITRKALFEGSGAYGPTSFTATTTSTPSTSLTAEHLEEMWRKIDMSGFKCR